jgi:hypothetical protein
MVYRTTYRIPSSAKTPSLKPFSSQARASTRASKKMPRLSEKGKAKETALAEDRE